MKIYLGIVLQNQMDREFPGLLGPLLKLERLSFQYQWTADDFCEQLSAPHTGIITARLRPGGTIVGYAIFRSLTTHEGEVLSFAVYPEFRGGGVATTMMRTVVGRLVAGQSAFCKVWERNTRALVFLRNRGFLFDGIVRRPYLENDDDAIRLRFTMTPPAAPPRPMELKVAGASPR